MTEDCAELSSYEVVVKLNKGIYFCRIPELMIIAKGENLDSCFQEIMRKKEEFFRETNAAEINMKLVGPSSDWYRGEGGKGVNKDGNNGENLKGFFIKTVVVLSVLLITFTFIGNKIENQFERASLQIDSSIDKIKYEVNKISKAIPKRPGRKIEQSIYRAAKHPVAPEREERIIKSLRVIVKKLKPFVDEVKPLFISDKGFYVKVD
jgi:hypothetical protein